MGQLEEKGPKTNGKIAPGAGRASHCYWDSRPHRRPRKRVHNALDHARVTLEQHGDRVNAAHARYLEVRRLLLIG
jgi:hypothetical protein